MRETQSSRNPATVLWDDRLRASPRRWIPELLSTQGNMRSATADQSPNQLSAAIIMHPPAAGGSTLAEQKSKTLALLSRSPAPTMQSHQLSSTQGDHTLARMAEPFPFQGRYTLKGRIPPPAQGGSTIAGKWGLEA